MTDAPLSGQDIADLNVVMAGIEALRKWQDATEKRARQKPLRELIWFYWQQPRLVQDAIRSKYPRSVDWSLAAREASAAGSAKLVIDHIRPMKLLIASLLEDPPTDLMTLRDRLDAGLACVVITAEESMKLTRAKVGHAVVTDDSDKYARHRKAGLDVSSFGPLA